MSNTSESRPAANCQRTTVGHLEAAELDLEVIQDALLDWCEDAAFRECGRDHDQDVEQLVHALGRVRSARRLLELAKEGVSPRKSRVRS
jgi:hypothetical protein